MAEEQVQQEHVGVKDTEEALVGLNEVSLLMVRRFKDGVQFDDFEAFWEAFKHDPDFKAKVQAAYEGWANIKKEIGDMDVKEGLELAGVQLGYLPKLLAELKKDEGEAPAPAPTPAA